MPPRVQVSLTRGEQDALLILVADVETDPPVR